RLKDFEPGGGVEAGAHLPERDDSDWLDVPVPGDVHRALVAAGRLPEPFDGMNVERCQWVEEKEWWYRLEFECPEGVDASRAQLHFEGLDTYATVWLNGERVGTAANMFTRHDFDVSAHLKPGERNVVAVRFDSTVKTIEGKDCSRFWAAFYKPRVWVRKAQMNFGWDWGPRLVTVGIWRGVSIRPRGLLGPIAARTVSIDERGAVVLVEAEVPGPEPGRWRVRARLTDGEREWAGEREACAGVAEVRLLLDRPRLWWTHDLGEPFLHDLTVTLLEDGEAIDGRKMRVGIRTIELLQEPDAEGKSFTFVLNGVRIFCKGADWAPADSFIGSISDERYRRLIALAQKANMNMIRIWGGGVYESDAFYRACDELGVLVWQDFMFACAAYPDYDEGFRDAAREEIRDAILRLRNHPCIALWCGNNENQWIDDMSHWKDPETPLFGRDIYERMIPEALARYDRSRPYWPGSPYGGDDDNSAREGDRHNWQVWGGQMYPRRFGEEPKGDPTPSGMSYRHYAEDECRFCSEFGIHASPPLRTLRRHIAASELEYDSEQFLYRIKDPDKDRKRRMMQAHIGEPTSLEQYETFSMLVQAEGLKYGIEHYRRRKFHCSGALFWQLNDCWPCISWSVLDYYLNPKAGWYYARRAYEPVLLSFADEQAGASLWGVNDTLTDYRGRAELVHADFDGQILRRE
ncbi:MAG: glycoside hydrolase family 2 protein, partial [Armatimonadota bacterium]